MSRVVTLFQSRLFHSICVGVVMLGVGIWAPAPRQSSYHLSAFGDLPVMHDGRVKSMESVARRSLLSLHNRQSLSVSGETIPPIQWLLTVISKPHDADQYPIFPIHHPDIRHALNANHHPSDDFSFVELVPFFPSLEQQMALIETVEPHQRSAYQQGITHLYNRLVLYHELKHRWFWSNAPLLFEASVTGDVSPSPMQQGGMYYAALVSAAAQSHVEEF